MMLKEKRVCQKAIMKYLRNSKRIVFWNKYLKSIGDENIIIVYFCFYDVFLSLILQAGMIL